MDQCSVEEVESDLTQKLSKTSLEMEFVPYEGYYREADDKFPHTFDVRSKFRSEKLEEDLKDLPKGTEKNGIEVQLEASDVCLENLLEFGNELVNNIKAANEQQELMQTKHKNQRAKELKLEVEKEAAETIGLVQKINAKWVRMNEMREPMAIFNEMEKQRENIAEMVASKDAMIAKCQQELKEMDDKYNAAQKKQSQDVCFLVERIDDQIELFKESYADNINQLQDAIDKERKRIHEAAKERWYRLYDHLSLNEEKKMEIVKMKREFYDQELEKISFKQQEITRATRIRLAKDAEMLEIEIRKTRANILMNSEKIDYNYQVLQRRNEENVIINNQQKRRVAKFSEAIVAIHHKMARVKERNKIVMEKLNDDIKKLHASSAELQLKADSFQKNNKQKFTKIWSMNFKEVKSMLLQVFEIERILYEQQLARRWEKPTIDFDQLDYFKEKETKPPVVLAPPKPRYSASRKEEKKPQAAKKVNQKQLNDILQKISDRAGFLIEERLLKILEPYTDQDKCLVRIENIFSALNVTDIEVVNSLVKYFEPYSWCPNCSTGLHGKTLKDLYSSKQNIDTKELDTVKSSETIVNCSNHVLVTEPTLVLTALNEFICGEMNKKVQIAEKRRGTIVDPKQIDPLQFDENQIREYWQQFMHCISDEKRKVWKTVEHGLNHYLEVLKKRYQLDGECVFLQNQNAELKHLLQKL